MEFSVIHTTGTGAPIHAPALCGLYVQLLLVFFKHLSSCLSHAQELLDGYTETGVAYLDLSYYPTDALTEAGPAACIAGELKLVPGMLGMPSQVSCLRMDTCMHACAWRCVLQSA